MESRRPYWQVALRLLFSLLATAAFIIIGLRLIVFLMPFVILFLPAALILGSKAGKWLCRHFEYVP